MGNDMGNKKPIELTKVREVSGNVSCGGNDLEPGAIILLQEPMFGARFFLEVSKTTTGATQSAGFFLGAGSITVRNDSLVFSELVNAHTHACETVYLKGAQPSQIQQFLDALPNSIKGKVMRIPSELDYLERELSEMQQQREENLQRQLREMQQREENLQRQLREMRQREENLQRQLTLKDRQVNELQLSLSTAQETIGELRRQETCDWVIARDEIQMTDTCLGTGGWGSVNEGRYCGCPVAVKQIHDLILSPHNRHLFEREMNIASKCRHPCLLQFIGSTNDEESPLFVTELMETSLRALLERRELSETEIFIISRDVARALNYLHQKKPKPIIHRDVSSANVLLWRQGDQWRGKVSDYGTANFMQNTMTVAPGAPIYSAPEAVSTNQTVKVDVFSFGVLLCEMCIRELPDPRRRDEQVVLVTNHVFRDLVRRCLQENPEMRPNMQQIIDELEEFNTS